MIPNPMAELIEELKECSNATEKFQFFIDMAEELPKISAEEKTDENKVMGCASNAWISATKKGEEIILKADADAIISKGFLSFFILGMKGWNAQQILEFSVNDLHEAGVIESLSPSRSNGALASLNKIHLIVGSLSDS